MADGSKLRIGLVAGAVVLVAAIYLLPKTSPIDQPETKEEVKAENVISFSFDEFVSSSKTKIGWDSGNKVSVW